MTKADSQAADYRAEAIGKVLPCKKCGGRGMDHRCKESCENCEPMPQPPGWLKSEEREALEAARLHLSNFDRLDENSEREARWAIEIISGLLARSTPPGAT
jgi:hypothetical protein